MAVKTFGSEILTSSDVNTYMANSGQVFIKQQAISAGSATVTLTNVFSSTYDHYRVLVNGVQSTSSLGLLIRMGSTATGYYGNFNYVLYSGTAFTFVPMNNATYWYIALSDSSSPSTSCSFDVFQPNMATKTMYVGQYYGRGYMGNFGGSLENSTQYTDLTIFNESGTLTSGTITVYGYRKV